MSNPERGTNEGRLPRLLYVGDVRVESTAHGSALLYRLLQDYPAGKLTILESNIQEPTIARRLPDRVYGQMQIGWKRPLQSRFNRFWAPWLSFMAGFKVRAVEQFVQGFAPEAVLTVHQGYGWLTAARFARRRKLPLHLILHDDWNRMAPFTEASRLWLDRKFRRIYRQAASRLCVSPYMVEEYRRRYGASGKVLYPSRAKDCPKFEEPPSRLLQPPEKFTMAYAGNIFSAGYWDALGKVAEVLMPMNGLLVLYSPHTREQARAAGLVSKNVECRGFMKSDDLIRRLRNEADVLFIPMSFDKVDRCNMEISFPSKLTDSTIPGVPLLIYGPDYCSAVRWARENPGVAEVVTQAGMSELETALHCLTNPSRRVQLGQTALRIGREFFSHTVAQDSFHASLVR